MALRHIFVEQFGEKTNFPTHTQSQTKIALMMKATQTWKDFAQNLGK